MKTNKSDDEEKGGFAPIDETENTEIELENMSLATVEDMDDLPPLD